MVRALVSPRTREPNMHASNLQPLFDGPVPQTDDPVVLLEWATTQFADSIALSTSLGPQTLVLIDMLHKLGRSVPVFCIDTGLLFEETYALWREVEAHYGIRIEGVSSRLTIEDQAARDGDRLWANAPDRCCAIRKVHPLRRRLLGMGAWITGLRRDPASATRHAVDGVEWDPVNGLFKINPLWAWSSETVHAYAESHSIPLNPLLSQGYRSIGCTHCTAPSSGTDERSGRWSGNQKTECGLHWATPQASKETSS